MSFQGKGGDDVCGSSVWKAARGNSSSKKNIDITGLEMMSCTHGTVVYSANLFKGETYSTHHKYWLTPCQFWCFNPREIGLTVSRAGIFKKY